MEGTPGPDEWDAAATAQRLSIAIKHLRSRLRAEAGMHETGLTVTQLSVLRSVLMDGPVTAARLATLQHVSPQSIAQSVAVLKAAGLVAGEQDPRDRRKTLLRATPSGQRLMTSLKTSRESFLERAITELLAPGEHEDLHRAIALLERFAEADLRGTLPAR
jgi:DNA-binding MarR family transcriptional regulator